MPRRYDDDEDDDRPRRRRGKRRGGPNWALIGGVGGGVLAVLVAVVVAVLLTRGKKDKAAAGGGTTDHAGKGTFTVGKDTTYVTGPLDGSGHIDYAAAANERMKKGVTPETNAVVLIWQAVGPRPEGQPMPAEFFQLIGTQPPPDTGDYFVPPNRAAGGNVGDQLDHAARVPWTATQYPELARWLSANEKPLALAVEASGRPNYFSPLVRHETGSGPAGLMEVRLPAVQRCRQLAQALAARAMLKAGGGQPAEAWQDLLACHRLGRLVGRGGTLIEGLVGFSIEILAGRADLALLDRGRPDAKLLERIQRDLRELPAPADVAAKVDTQERFMLLDTVMMLDRLGVAYIDRASGGKAQQPHPLADDLLDGIDWDPALRSANRWFDRLVAAMREKDRAARDRALNGVEDELRAIGSRVVPAEESRRRVRESKEPAKAKGEVAGEFLVGRLLPAVRKIQDAADRVAQTNDNLAVAVALARHRLDAGQYPNDLAALAPKYLPAVPGDLFSGRPLVYRTNGSGYLLYSVGPNGQDEGGRTTEDQPQGDDIAVRMPVPQR